MASSSLNTSVVLRQHRSRNSTDLELSMEKSYHSCLELRISQMNCSLSTKVISRQKFYNALWREPISHTVMSQLTNLFIIQISGSKFV